MLGKITVESINYDYLPGEPESRKTWFFTLREPPFMNLFQKFVYLKSINSTNAMFTKNHYFFVYDVHGRSLVVEPANSPKFNPNITNSVELLNATGRDPIPDEFFSNTKFIMDASKGHSSIGTPIYSNFPKVPVILDTRDIYPRLGVDVYAHRPSTQKNRVTSDVIYRH
jgi:hypothetical protein